jgi:DNA-binding LacI/PurR family transcriptional regulator
MSAHRAPSLTTFHVRCMGIGTEAALKLIGLIEKGSPPMILDLPVERVGRRSKAPVPAEPG